MFFAQGAATTKTKNTVNEWIKPATGVLPPERMLVAVRAIAPVAGSPHREEGTLASLPRWADLLGLLCRSGFVIEDLFAPLHARPDAERGTFAHRSRYVAPYVRIKARRVGAASQTPAAKTIWTP